MENMIEEMNKIKWYHRIFINGVMTPGANYELQNSLNILPLPEDLTGKSVLDIGCWDGYYSFECEKRNAKRVVANDKFMWEKESSFWSKDQGFDFAHKHLNSKVEKVISSVEDLEQKNLGTFDYVLMLCVVCLSKNPVQYIEIAKNLCSGTLILELHVDMLDIPYPAAKYYTGNHGNDEINDYWGMNPLAVQSIMEDLGFTNISYKIIEPGNRAIFSGDILK
jgi:tRNA (mo5U34)-methyltransferase